MRRITALATAASIALLGTAALLERFVPATPHFLLRLLCGLGLGFAIGALFTARLPDACDTATPALRRRYLREFVPATVAYVATLSLSITLLKRVDDTVLRALIALLPIPAVALLVRAMLRHIRDTDELQRRIEVESISIGTALVSLGYLGAGFLQSAKVIDVPASAAMIWVFPMVCLSYGLTKIVLARRYG